MNRTPKEPIVKSARLAMTHMTRNAGQRAFARAAFVGGVQLLASTSFAQRPGHAPCVRGYEDHGGSPGAGSV